VAEEDVLPPDELLPPAVLPLLLSDGGEGVVVECCVEERETVKKVR